MEEQVLDTVSQAVSKEKEKTWDQKRMGVLEHLEELRGRLVICIVALAVTAVVGFFLSDWVIHQLAALVIKQAGPLKFTGVADAFMARLKIGVIIGIALALPIIFYELWQFVAPGLKPSERKWGLPFVLAAIALFAIGAVFAYMVLPYGLSFLLGFASADMQPLLMVDRYFSFVSIMMLLFGLVFDLPIVLLLLVRVGLINSRQMKKRRVMSILAILFLAYMITPGADPVSPLFLAIALIILYEATIWVAVLMGR